MVFTGVQKMSSHDHNVCLRAIVVDNCPRSIVQGYIGQSTFTAILLEPSIILEFCRQQDLNTDHQIKKQKPSQGFLNREQQWYYIRNV